jgi:hypothetical protein
MARWFDPMDVAIFPTLSDDERRCRGLVKIHDDDAEGPRPPRQRARPHLGEAVTAATIYGRARRARLKAAKQASDAI